ncbi:MAG: hypothetical protein ACRD96_04475, partial [Bryobacteraceae bacterium]
PGGARRHAVVGATRARLVFSTEARIAGHAIVLAQVSMAHLASALATRLALPVFDSLQTSLEEVVRVSRQEGASQ